MNDIGISIRKVRRLARIFGKIKEPSPRKLGYYRHFPIVVPDCTVVTGSPEQCFMGLYFLFTGSIGQQTHPVDFNVFRDRRASRLCNSGVNVEMMDGLFVCGSSFNLRRPLNKIGNMNPAFKIGDFLTPERFIHI